MPIQSFQHLAVPSINGMNTYQPGKPIDELQRQLGIKHIVKLASNENPLGPSEHVKQVVRESMDDLSRYPDGNGFYLKRALAEKIGVDTAMVTLGNGSNDVLDVIARVFLTVGREAVYSEHAFVVYGLSTQAVGATARVAAAKNYGHDLQAMQALINEKTSVVFIANPNNPTGTWLEANELENFIQALPVHVMVVLDEAYGEYLDPSEAPKSIVFLKKYPNVIITRTFSKAYGLAGLRVGYALSQPGVADLLNRVRHPFNVNSLGLVAAQAALEDRDYIDKSRLLNGQGMQQLEQGFEQLGLNYIPSVANFITVELGEKAADVYQALLQKGVIVRPVAGYQLPHHLRVSIGLPNENATCLDALEKVLQGV
ncbi:MAG: histidinol-phosphate transaminase [Cycloclasticus sp.]|nr:histidinol-phosphate transaminase [Cycloclasticus sp.]MBQ0789419.1 histidinol-phosphate transaminase [Cycloclasticus sp.]